jgi:outer membrane protein insertion porin family/translocation and assembly module TamA
VNPSAEVIPGYNELRVIVGPERRIPGWALTVGLPYSLQANFPFTYFGPLSPAFQNVLVSSLDLRVRLDLRDDPVRPTAGFVLANSVQMAGGPLGGDADDVRERPEMRLYVPVARDVTLAGRVLFGFLFPRNYGALIGQNFETLPDQEVPAYIRDLQIVYFRGFISGGPDSNRGYGYADIGPHGVNPLLIPGTIAEEKLRCDPNLPRGPNVPPYDERLCLVASGGLTLWEASFELRAPLAGDVGAVFFVDASDVSPNKLDVRLYVPHLSAGFGIRYATPVGPLRLDLGFRIPGMQRIGAPLNPLTDGTTPSPLLGFLPAALSLGLGETY